MSRVASFGQISEITNYLYLSGVHVIRSDLIKKRRIVCIVNATAEESLGQFCHVPGVEYMKVRVDDSPNSQICTHFDSVADKIKSVQDRGYRTLVHCVAGVSRSATLCIAYLIKYENLTLRDAYYCVKQARPIIRPNEGFWAQLIEYERQLKGQASVQMVVSSAYGRDKPVPDVYLEEQKLVPINPLKNHNSSWRLANKFASRFSTPCNTNSGCGKSNKNSKNRGNDKMNNNPNNIGFLSDCETTTYNKRCSISLNNSPTSNLAARLASRYGNGRQNAAPATTFSALTLANSVIPLKSRLKVSLFNAIYDTGSYPTMNDIFFPNF